MTKELQAFLEGMTETQKQNFKILLENAEREQERYTVPLQSHYNTDEKSIEAIAYINNQFFKTKFKHIVRSFFDVFPELKGVEGAKESIEEILRRKVGVPMGAAGAATATQPPGQYRTLSRAGSDIQRKMPVSLAIPSYEPYRYSMSLNQEGNAYLQPLTSTDGLKFQGGKLYFTGDKVKQVSEMELQNMKTKEGIENIDLPFLRVIYSLILKDFEDNSLKFTARTHKWYIPTFAQYLGLGASLSKKNIQSIIDRVQSYHNITGILHGTRNGKPVQSLYQVLNFESYDDTTNTIEISSPYMRYVIETVYNVTIKKSKGKPMLKKNGEPMRIASHSYLIHADIAKEKNKAAVENVVIIVSGIEQSGSKGYHIAATTLIEKNPQLKERLSKSNNEYQLLKRVFSKTYELLRTKTDLEKAYVNISLPDPGNPALLPTKATLDGLVIDIPHEGKDPTYKKQ